MVLIQGDEKTICRSLFTVGIAARGGWIAVWRMATAKASTRGRPQLACRMEPHLSSCLWRQQQIDAERRNMTRNETITWLLHLLSLFFDLPIEWPSTPYREGEVQISEKSDGSLCSKNIAVASCCCYYLCPTSIWLSTNRLFCNVLFGLDHYKKKLGFIFINNNNS